MRHLKVTGVTRVLRAETENTGWMMEYERVMRDEIARKNALRRDKASQKTTVIHYDFDEGEIVSHAGVFD